MSKRTFDQIAEGMHEAIAAVRGGASYSGNVAHRITGYDKDSEALQCEFDVPADFVLAARRVAEAPDDWQVAPGAFPLTGQAVWAIGAMLKTPLNVDRYDWFLEPVSI